MPKAVLDTNILVSALITPRGTPAKILQTWRTGRFELVTSPPLLLELKDVLSRPKIRERYHLTPADIRDLLSLLATAAVLAPASGSISASLRDPDDLPVLACAVGGHADYIVTGDRDLLRLSSYEGIQIVRPSKFLQAVISPTEGTR